MELYIATDHAGFELKNTLVSYLRDELGHTVIDCGAVTFNPEDDFVPFIRAAARKVSESPDTRRAIILGGSGQGEAICANRLKYVRAAVFYGGDERIITLSREHNDANVLSLGARFIDGETAKRVVQLWLATPRNEDEKYIRRNRALG